MLTKTEILIFILKKSLDLFIILLYTGFKINNTIYHKNYKMKRMVKKMKNNQTVMGMNGLQGNEFCGDFYTQNASGRLINKSMLSHSANGRFAAKTDCIKWIDAIDNNGFKFERRFLITNACMGYFPTAKGSECGDVQLMDGTQIQLKADLGCIKVANDDKCDAYAIENSNKTGYWIMTKTQYLENVENMVEAGMLTFRKANKYMNTDHYQVKFPRPYGKGIQKQDIPKLNILTQIGAEYTPYPPEIAVGIGRNTKTK